MKEEIRPDLYEMPPPDASRPLARCGKPILPSPFFTPWFNDGTAPEPGPPC